MVPVLFIPILKSKERHRLQDQLHRTRDARYSERLRSVLWSEQGKSVTEISRLLARHPSSVQRWLHDYRHFGVQGLKVGKSPGRPPAIDAEGLECLRQTLGCNRRDFDYPFTRWTAATLATHLYRQTHTRVCELTVLRTMKRMRYRYKRPKLSLRHRQNRRDVNRARIERDAALKKQSAIQTASSLSSKTNASFISTPVLAGCGR